MITRRTLLRGTAGTLAGTLAGTMVPRSAKGAVVKQFQELPTARDERLHMLIMTAVDTAMAAGAVYADARLTFTQGMGIDVSGNLSEMRKWGGPTERKENLHVGVRAQYDGYWGFASSPVWTKEEATRLGRTVVAEAKANVLGKPRDLVMTANRGATSGDWSMPVTDDPFAMDVDELYDYLAGLARFIWQLPNDMHLGMIQQVRVSGAFLRQQKAFGSSDGQFVTQRVYRTGGHVGLLIDDQDPTRRIYGALDQITEAGAGLGFEYLRHAQVRDWVRQLYADLEEERKMPIVPVDVGKYLSLIPATGVADLVKRSVGIATEIDRVMGYEANATGTSYIMDPDAMVGSLKIGTPAMQVTGTRSSPGGLAHVKWDDEGVAPKDFTLIQNGVLTTLQTNREGAAWMKPSSASPDQPLRSLGCAHGVDASDPQVVHPADLRLHPDAAQDTTFDQLRAQMDKGVEFKTGAVSMDFQQSTGMMIAPAFKIENGKRVARIATPGMLFRTSELWGNLQALGGPGSVWRVGTVHMKGEPIQMGYSSVDAPPALFKEMSVINPAQKA